MKIHPFTLLDLAGLDGIAPSDWGDLKPIFRFYFLAPFCQPVKVELNGMIAGVGCAIRHMDTAWLGHIIVHPKHRQKGTGTMLTRYLLERLVAEKFTSVSLVSTPDAVPMYERLGFTKQWTYRFFRDPQQFIPPRKPELIKDYGHEHLYSLLKLDRDISGEDRKYVLGYHLGGCKIYLTDEELRGAYFPTLGGGMVLARDGEAGIDLAKYRMLEKSRAVVPEQNTRVIELIKSMHMHAYHIGVRMFYGKPVELAQGGLYNRIGGNMG